MSIRTSAVAQIFEKSVTEIVPAPINVHTVENSDDPEFVGLVNSVKANGIIHRILVRSVGDGTFQIIDGHRRFKAALAAGMKSVPVEVLDADEAKSAILTVATNVQRRSNDPLLEAELIAWLRRQGLKLSEVATELGKTEAYVATRAKLTDLTTAWRTLAKRRKCTTDLLVKVARHSPELQDEVAEEAQIEEYGEDSDELGWGDFEYMFESRMHRISNAPFDTVSCMNCPHNTAMQGLLFADDSDKDARCECASCFISKANKTVDDAIAALREEGNPAIEVLGRYYVPNSWDAKHERDEQHPQAYVFADGKIRAILWSVKKEEKKTEAKTAEERRREREERKAAKELESAKERVRISVNAAIEKSADRFETIVNRISRSDGFAKWASKMMMRDFSGGCFDTGTATDFIAMCGGTLAFERAFGMAFPADECKAIATVIFDDKENAE